MGEMNRRCFIRRTLLAACPAAQLRAAQPQETVPSRKSRAGPPISCIPILFFKDMLRANRMSLADWIKMACRLELDGIELYERYLKTQKAAVLRRLSGTIHDAGLSVSMFTSYANFAPSAPPIRLKEVAHVKWAVDAAVIFKARIVRITAGYWPKGIETDLTLRQVADGIRQCLDHAERRGVMLALEDHPEIGTRTCDFVRILELVDDQRLKVNLDTSNPMVSGNSALELVKLVQGRVVHVHASDRSEDLEHTVAGAGVVDFPGIFRILKGSGFSGWISLEAGGTEGEESIRQGLDYIKRTWARA